MKFNLTSLREKDLKVVEKKKLFFSISATILVVAIIAGLIFGLALKAPLNLNMDFTGGYTVTIKTGGLINEGNYEEYGEKIKTAVEDFRFPYENNEYGVRFEDIRRLGSENQTSLRIDYKADRKLPSSVRDDAMEQLNEALIEKLNSIVGYLTPVLVNFAVVDGTKYATVTYNAPIKEYAEGNKGGFKTMLDNAGVGFSGDIEVLKDDNGVYNTAKFVVTDDSDEAAITTALTIDKYFSARAISADKLSGAVSAQIIYTAITAVLLTLMLITGYVFLRFGVASGLAVVITVLHDIILVFAFMAIFHIELNATFVAALIAVLCYSIFNTVSVFDKVREIRKAVLFSGKADSVSDVCNKAISGVLPRLIATSVAMLVIMATVLVVCLIGGVFGLASFALPVMFGVIISAFSSLCIAPSLWVLLKRNGLGSVRTPREGKKENKESSTHATEETN